MTTSEIMLFDSVPDGWEFLGKGPIPQGMGSPEIQRGDLIRWKKGLHAWTTTEMLHGDSSFAYYAARKGSWIHAVNYPYIRHFHFMRAMKGFHEKTAKSLKENNPWKKFDVDFERGEFQPSFDSKRIQAAITIAAGLAANPNFRTSDVAQTALQIADALILASKQ